MSESSFRKNNNNTITTMISQRVNEINQKHEESIKLRNLGSSNPFSRKREKSSRVVSCPPPFTTNTHTTSTNTNAATTTAADESQALGTHETNQPGTPLVTEVEAKWDMTQWPRWVKKQYREPKENRGEKREESKKAANSEKIEDAAFVEQAKALPNKDEHAGDITLSRQSIPVEAGEDPVEDPSLGKDYENSEGTEGAEEQIAEETKEDGNLLQTEKEKAMDSHEEEEQQGLMPEDNDTCNETPNINKAKGTRHQWALFAGISTLMVFGYSTLTLALATEAVTKPRDTKDQNLLTLAWIETGVSLSSMVACVALIGWIRIRRRTIFSVFAIPLAGAIYILHVGLAVINQIWALLERDLLSERCTWGIDIAWINTKAGKICSPEKRPTHVVMAWGSAIAVRLLLTAGIGFCWLLSIKRFYRSLPRESSYTGVALMDKPFGSSRHPDWLPEMPDRDRFFFVSEYSQSEEAVLYDGGGPNSAKPGTSGSWLGGALWGAVSWIIGAESQETTQKTEHQALNESDLEHNEARSRALRAGEGSESLPGQRMSLQSSTRATVHIANLAYHELTKDDSFEPVIDLPRERISGSFAPRNGNSVSSDTVNPHHELQLPSWLVEERRQRKEASLLKYVQEQAVLQKEDQVCLDHAIRELETV